MLGSIGAILVQAQDSTAGGGMDLGGFPLIPFVVTLIAGAAGGLAYELMILQGAVERGHKLEEDEVAAPLPHAVAKYVYDLGLLARMIIGALAAVAIQLVFTPETWMALIGTSVVAGSAGISVFQSLQNRLLTSTTQTRLLQAEGQIAAAREEVARVLGDLDGDRDGQLETVLGARDALQRVSGMLSRPVRASAKAPAFK